MFTVTKAFKEALLQHFIYQKLEISYAIHKPFPFFEGLRDKSLITDRMYKESLEACQNMVPVSRVVHNVLTNLERTFDLSLLVVLFSSINLREYPNLVTILRSFRSAANDKFTSKTNDDEDSEEKPSPSPGRLQVIREDSPEPNGPEEAQKVSGAPPNKKGKKIQRSVLSTPKKRHQNKDLLRGAFSPPHGTQEKLQVVDQVTQMKDDSKKQSVKGDMSPKVSERPEDELGGLHSPELPVTCGEAKGILYKEKMAQGPSEKCIQNEEGAWFTPREFEVAGNRAQSKNWKRSVLCRGQTLGQLLEKGLLLCPSRKQMQTSIN
ncbi:interferon-induced protein 75-like, partial [Orycteropus afer afer]|uniref:Interferon-induced protein 75-like n=1 Tax=Orycteropus afer afer TaxID=1230840 RepID=A0AC54Z9X3_ORYAF